MADTVGDRVDVTFEDNKCPSSDIPQPLQPENDEEKNIWQLDNLPPEIFLHICSFLSAKFVLRVLSKVCEDFHNIIMADNTFWRIRIGRRWPKKYPAIPVNENEFNWKEACMEREEQQNIWSNPTDNVDYFHYTTDLSASVDAVHLMDNGRFLAAGSRDRCLSLLDVSKLDSNSPESLKNAKVFATIEAHTGWIWSLSSYDGTLATGCWDMWIRFFDIAGAAQIKHKVKCHSAILCTHLENDVLIAGSYDKRVYHVDTRMPSSIVNEKKYHKKPVLCLTADDRYIISGSEDKTVAIFDRRADSVLKYENFDAFPMSLSYESDQLWVGDKAGKIHLLDGTDGDFNMVATYDVGHKGKVTGLIHTMGAMYTCSTDHVVKVLEPSLNPSVITNLEQQSGEVAGISYQGGVLACAGSNISVGIWRPKCLGL